MFFCISALSQESVATLAKFEPDQLGVLDSTLVWHCKAAIRTYVERILIARRRPKGARGGAHHALIGPGYRCARAGWVDAEERMRRMCRQLKRSGLAEGEIVTNEVSPHRFDRSRRSVC